LTAHELARLTRARRSGNGKWMAKCPVHGRDRSPSLSITDMGGGDTRIHCFAGCSQKDVLAAFGLTWKDLKGEKQLDREAMRAIEHERRLQEERARYRRNLRIRALNKASMWEKVSQELARLLNAFPDDQQTCRLFHWSLWKMRQCEVIANVYDLGSNTGFPKWPRKKKLTLKDCGEKIGVRLGLYE